MRRAAVGFALVLAALRADAQNLLPDPAFASGVSGWTVTGVGSPTFQWLNLPGPDGVPGIGRLQYLGPASAFAQACVPVVPGTTYSFGASFFAISAGGQAIVEFYPNGTCAGSMIVGSAAGPQNSVLNAWQFEPGPDVAAPAGAGSALFRIHATTGASTLSTLDVDNVYFGLQGTGPPGLRDVPALSEPLLVALALALALAALRLLRPA